MSSAPIKTFHHDRFPLDLIARERADSIAVCIPARDEAPTIGRTVEAALVAVRAGAVDEVVVIDDRSTDGTGRIAAAAGARVVRSGDALGEGSEIGGKGDVLRGALAVVETDLVCFVDADSADFGTHFVSGLVGPLTLGDEVDLVKGFYRRPFRAGGAELEAGGGRVTELLARPLLRSFYPELAAVRQPLAGEFAARTTLLERLELEPGYGVEIGILIDAFKLVGADRIAQVDLDVRRNTHRTLAELGPTADAVLAAVLRRLTEEGRLAEYAELVA